jgi:hypothetical protein
MWFRGTTETHRESRGAIRTSASACPPERTWGGGLDRRDRQARDVDAGNHERVWSIWVQDDFLARSAFRAGLREEDL